MKLQSLFVAIAMAAPVYSKEPLTIAPVLKDRLRQELLAMAKEDQAARSEMLKSMKDQGISIGSLNEKTTKNPVTMLAMITIGSNMAQVDRKNLSRLKQIVEKNGWPGNSLVGVDGANSAWLIVQHADSDLPFQKKCLALMEATPNGEVSKKDIAYLTDRVLVAERKKQRYGTQMGAHFELRPIEDEEHVDERRAKIGLPPVAEYVKNAKEQYEKMSQRK